MDRVGPPDDAYGRVTDAARYGILVETAEQVTEALDAAYQVEISVAVRSSTPSSATNFPSIASCGSSQLGQRPLRSRSF